MRIFGTFFQYEGYLNNRIAAIPPDKDLSYSFLQKWIADDFAVVFQGLFRELTKQLDAEAADWTLPNSKQMQKAWASENQFEFSGPRSDVSILLEQLKRFRPDIYLAFGYPLHCNFLNLVKREVPTIRLIATWDGRRMHDLNRFHGSDLIFSCLEESVRFYRNHGLHSEYLPYFFDTNVLSKLSTNKKVNRIVFPGSIQISSDGHNDRLRLQEVLCKMKEYEPYLDLAFLKNWRVWAGMIKRGDFAHLITLLRLIPRNRSPVYGMEMFNLLASSLVTANIHIDAAGPFAANIRLFEATGVASCLLTDSKPNLHNFFTIDSEVVVYKTFSEALEKARWLLNNPEIAIEIGIRAASRTKIQHSAKERACELFHTLRTKL